MQPQHASPEGDALFVVFSSARHRFAVPYGAVEQMVSPPPQVPVPHLHPAVRGVINLRGDVLGLVCLRALIGARTMLAENGALAEELDHREEDHVAWLAELEASTREGRPFTLTTDPHACKFGRWFDTYQPANEDLRALVTRLGPAHEAIHGIAERVVALGRRGQHAEALAVIEETRNRELARLERLLDRVRDYLRDWRRDIALILRQGARAPVALLVDAVESVIPLDLTDASEGTVASSLGPLFPRLATDADHRIINLLDVEALYSAIAA